MKGISCPSHKGFHFIPMILMEMRKKRAKTLNSLAAQCATSCTIIRAALLVAATIELAIFSINIKSTHITSLAFVTCPATKHWTTCFVSMKWLPGFHLSAFKIITFPWTLSVIAQTAILNAPHHLCTIPLQQLPRDPIASILKWRS